MTFTESSTLVPVSDEWQQLAQYIDNQRTKLMMKGGHAHPGHVRKHLHARRLGEVGCASVSRNRQPGGHLPGYLPVSEDLPAKSRVAESWVGVWWVHSCGFTDSRLMAG